MPLKPGEKENMIILSLLTKYQLTFFYDITEAQAGQVSRTSIKCGLQNSERADEKV